MSDPCGVVGTRQRQVAESGTGSACCPCLSGAICILIVLNVDAKHDETLRRPTSVASNHMSDTQGR
eukprot:1393474-Amorphochlora_amoeboformis.AAC.2